MNPQVVETLFLLSFGHLFGLYNPNQLVSALGIPKASLYRHLTALSPDQWKWVGIEIAGTMAIESKTPNRKAMFGAILAHFHEHGTGEYG